MASRRSDVSEKSSELLQTAQSLFWNLYATVLEPVVHAVMPEPTRRNCQRLVQEANNSKIVKDRSDLYLFTKSHSTSCLGEGQRPDQSLVQGVLCSTCSGTETTHCSGMVGEWPTMFQPAFRLPLLRQLSGLVLSVSMPTAGIAGSLLLQLCWACITGCVHSGILSCCCLLPWALSGQRW